MDVTHSKVRRQRRRGVYRLPISAAASAKWQKEGGRDRQTAQSQARGRRGKRDMAAELAAGAAEPPRGLTAGWDGDGDGHGLCDDAFKQFVHECGEDIKGSLDGARLSLQRITAQSELGSSDGCENNELGRELDVGVGQETESDSVLRFTDVKFNDCEEFLKVPEADIVSDLADLRYDSVLQPSNSEGSIEPEQTREAILTNIASQEQSSTAGHTNSSGDLTREGEACATPFTQMYQNDPEQSRERDAANTELTAEEGDTSLNIAQLYESCSPAFEQESSLGTAEDCKDLISRNTYEQDPWGKSITLDQNCNLLEVTGEQTNTLSEVSSAVENLLDQFDPTRIKVENTEPIFQGIQGTQEYFLLEEDEGEVVLTLAVGDGGQLVPTAGGLSAQLPPGLAEQLAASHCVSAAPGASAAAPRSDGGGGGLQEQEASLLLSDADLVLAGEAIQEALEGMGSPPPAQQLRREERLHFGDVEEALDAIENGGQPRRQRPRQHRAPPRAAVLPAKMGSGVHKEVERAAKALFSKRTRTLYHWMYPDTPKRKLKATVANAWDTLPESEKLIYMSQVMGRFGTPASNLMVNPQLVGMSADQLETECAVAGLLAAEAAQEADESSGDGESYRAVRKRAPLAALPAFHGKRSRAAQQPLFSDTELDPCKQDTDDEISTAELFAPLGI